MKYKYKLKLLRKPFVDYDDDNWDADDKSEFRGHLYIDKLGAVAACRPDGQWLYWILLNEGVPAWYVPSELGFRLGSEDRITGKDLKELRTFVKKHRKESE